MTVDVTKIAILDGNISVEWDDGHQSIYEARYLRLNCGCAECVEEWSRRKLLDPANIESDLRAEDYLIVGKYAVQFLWSDAHFTGIFPFDLLRKLCKCEICETSRSKNPDELDSTS